MIYSNRQADEQEPTRSSLLATFALETFAFGGICFRRHLLPAAFASGDIYFSCHVLLFSLSDLIAIAPSLSYSHVRILLSEFFLQHAADLTALFSLLFHMLDGLVGCKKR